MVRFVSGKKLLQHLIKEMVVLNESAVDVAKDVAAELDLIPSTGMDHLGNLKQDSIDTTSILWIKILYQMMQNNDSNIKKIAQSAWRELPDVKNLIESNVIPSDDIYWMEQIGFTNSADSVYSPPRYSNDRAI